MNSARLLPNGDLVFPRRGDPPVNVPGYIRDEKDPFHFIQEMEDCKFRQMKSVKQPCGRFRTVMWCDHFKCETSSFKCESCLEIK